MALSKIERRSRIRHRVRKDIRGTAEQPRLAVFRSNKEIYAQMINDLDGSTIVAASSLDKGMAKEGTKADVAKAVGKRLAEKALEKGVETCAFDRGGYRYHGRVKSLAEGAREAGLKF